MVFSPFMKFVGFDFMVVIISVMSLVTFVIYPEFYLGVLAYDMFNSIILILVIFVFISAFSFSEKKSVMSDVMVVGMVFTFVFFLTSNILLFFLSFEISLIPILIIIVSFGGQPERVRAGKFMIIYTIVGSAPLLLGVLDLFFVSKVSSLYMLDVSLFFYSSFHVIMYMMAFLVKIPMFFFHFWLPKAHVEAPLEGSMILAGLMLKMGFYGLFRFKIFMLSVYFPIFKFLFSVSLWGAVITCFLSMSCDDMKMCVAYSSIMHMNMLLCGLFSFKFTMVWSCLIIMFSHGLISSLMFYLVTLVYLETNSRSIIFSKGVCSYFSGISLFSLVVWGSNLAVPPSVGFMAELMIVFSVMSISLVAVFLIMLSIFLNSIFSMFYFGLMSHSSSKLLLKSSISKFSFFYSFYFMITPIFSMFFIFSML